MNPGGLVLIKRLTQRYSAIRANDLSGGDFEIPIDALCDGVPLLYGAFKGDRGQDAAPEESIITDGGHAIRDVNTGQTCTVSEGMANNGGHAVGDFNARQARAVVESSLVNDSQLTIFTKGYTGQPCTAVESIVANGS